jgi:site-specific DNA recombinase
MFGFLEVNFVPVCSHFKGEMMSTKDPSRGVAYYRMSTAKQEASIPEQRAWAHRAAQAHGVEIVAEFQDDGICGDDMTRRKGLAQMLAWCACNDVNAVIVWDPDRLSRSDSIRTSVVLNTLMESGVTRLLTPDGWIDLENDVDRLLFNIRQDMSRAAYVKSLSRNVTRSALARARQGLWPAGRPPYGYIIGPDGRLALGDPEEVATVRWIFHEYATTADSAGVLAQRLQEEIKAPCPRARGKGSEGHRFPCWERFTVWHILTNRAYLGELCWNKWHIGKYSQIVDGEVVPKHGGKQKTQRNAMKDRVVVEGAHPPLVDPETFQRCQEKLRSTRKGGRTTPIRGGGEWVLSGLAYCAECGRRMIGHVERQRRQKKTYIYRRYQCMTSTRQGPGACQSNAATQELILQTMAEEIRRSFSGPTQIAKLEAEVARLAQEQEKGDDDRRRHLRQQVAKLGQQIDQGTARLALCAADMIDGITATVRKWREERDELQRELTKLDSIAAAGDQFIERVRDALAQIKRLEELVQTAPAREVRNMLAGLVSKVTLHFRHDPPLKDGRRRHYLDHLEIEFVPEVAQLLSSGSNPRYCRWSNRGFGHGRRVPTDHGDDAPGTA